MSQIVWLPQMALGIPEVDSAHKEFMQELQETANAPDEEFAPRMFALVATLERNFREEEEVMEDAGFPGLPYHQEQHARVLAGLHHVVPKVMDGDLALGRQAVNLLGQWFLYHLTTMDVAFGIAYLRAHPSLDKDVQQARSAGWSV